MVLAAAMPGKTRGRIQIGADDPSLTAADGMLAVTELFGKLGLTGTPRIQVIFLAPRKDTSFGSTAGSSPAPASG